MPKATPYRNEKYLRYVRSHVSCLSWDSPRETLRFDEVEGAEPTVAHHIRMGHGGGQGLKPSDYRTVPLTDAEHRRLHQTGEREFWELAGVDPVEVIIALLTDFLGIEAKTITNPQLFIENFGITIKLWKGPNLRRGSDL